MPRKGVPGVITVGNRREWPSSAWGWKDWEDEERLQARLNNEIGKSVVTPPPGPEIASGFSLFAKPRGKSRGARSDAVDKLLDELGIGKR
jgi:hypothetical protein